MLREGKVAEAMEKLNQKVAELDEKLGKETEERAKLKAQQEQIESERNSLISELNDVKSKTNDIEDRLSAEGFNKDENDKALQVTHSFLRLIFDILNLNYIKNNFLCFRKA